MGFAPKRLECKRNRNIGLDESLRPSNHCVLDRRHYRAARRIEAFLQGQKVIVLSTGPTGLVFVLLPLLQ